ncbi:hypothetical protein O3M35_002575 [Rhynocoris fuscipes]|uniref:Uncharacterized protein n=1 Tax=Rhynocoris fuscipes TaxID=488301 RepID=A0AAW1CTF4_9HEMI
MKKNELTIYLNCILLAFFSANSSIILLKSICCTMLDSIDIIDSDDLRIMFL